MCNVHKDLVLLYVCIHTHTQTHTYVSISDALSVLHGAAALMGIAFSFAVDGDGVQLIEPAWPCLDHILERNMTPTGVLFELIQKGLYLAPDPSDIQSAGLVFKVSLRCKSRLRMKWHQCVQDTYQVYMLCCMLVV